MALLDSGAWDSSPTKGAGGMKRVFAPARECDAARLKGKPAFTGQPPPKTASVSFQPTHTVAKMSFFLLLMHQPHHQCICMQSVRSTHPNSHASSASGFALSL